MIFLMHYHRTEGRLVSMRPFDDAELNLASTAKIDLEISLLGSGEDVEVVLLRAETEEILRESHSRYFQSLKELKASSSKGQ